MGFTPSKVEPDIWMHHINDHYEYIAMYVDDLTIASKVPRAIVDILTNVHGFKLKGMGPIEYHLGIPSVVMSEDRSVSLLGSNTSTRWLTPMCNSSAPSLLPRLYLHLRKEIIARLMILNSLMLRTLRCIDPWLGQCSGQSPLGIFDISMGVMTLSSFWAQPCHGHLECVKPIYGYLYKLILCMYSGARLLQDQEEEYNWSKSVYGNVSEVVLKDVPEPLGNYMTLSHYVDANLYHDMPTGHSITGILHFLNKMPIDWYSKKQATVETAAY